MQPLRPHSAYGHAYTQAAYTYDALIQCYLGTCSQEVALKASIRTMRMKISNQFAPVLRRLFGGELDWISSNAWP